MKKIFLLLAGILFISALHAQDVITLKNGTQVRGTVTDVTPTQVKYLKQGADSSTVILDKKDILVIDYKDGSTLVLNNITPKDNEPQYTNFMKRFFVTIGSGFNYTVRNGIYANAFYYTFSSYLPSSFSLGITVSRRVSFDMELDYNNADYIYSYEQSYTTTTALPHEKPVSQLNTTYLSQNGNANQFNLIPNIIITANQHKFTPYWRLGFLVNVYSNSETSSHTLNYINHVLTSVQDESNDNTSRSQANFSNLAAFGCNWKLTKTLSVFGEGFYKGEMLSVLFDDDSFDVNSNASIGVNLGLRMTL